MGLFDLVDMGLCRWWVWDVGLCQSLWLLLLLFFFFFLEVALVDVGLCRWWPSVLLQQWLLVAVVAAWWLGYCW